MMKTYFLCVALHVLILYRVTSGRIPAQGKPEVQIYCQASYFRASCQPSEIIVIRSANYGRMRKNRCVVKDFGYVGCSRDALPVLDALCSGRYTCAIKVLDEAFPDVKSCHEDLKSYLEVSYECIQVVSVPAHQCSISSEIPVPETSGYLSSTVAAETRCGSTDTPWVISASPGQRINVTLLDFSTQQPNASSTGVAMAPGFSKVCRVYATVREENGDRSVSVCGGDVRERVVYISMTSQVQVRFLGGKLSQSPIYFILHYEAIGCPDAIAPSGGWVKRDDQVALLGCTDTTEMWQITCTGNTWVGPMRNCTAAPQQRTQPESGGLFSMPTGLSIIIVVVLALVVGSVILAVGLVCLKRPRQEDPGALDCAESEGILLRDHICEVLHPKQTIVCSIQNTQTTTLVQNMKDQNGVDACGPDDDTYCRTQSVLSSKEQARPGDMYIDGSEAAYLAKIDLERYSQEPHRTHPDHVTYDVRQCGPMAAGDSQNGDAPTGSHRSMVSHIIPDYFDPELPPPPESSRLDGTDGSVLHSPNCPVVNRGSNPVHLISTLPHVHYHRCEQRPFENPYGYSADPQTMDRLISTIHESTNDRTLPANCSRSNE